MAGSSADAENARKTWEIENEVETLPASDEIFRYDAQEQQQFLAARKLSEFQFQFFFVCCFVRFVLLISCLINNSF